MKVKEEFHEFHEVWEKAEGNIEEFARVLRGHKDRNGQETHGEWAQIQ